jgi:hypothetical protein
MMRGHPYLKLIGIVSIILVLCLDTVVADGEILKAACQMGDDSIAAGFVC